MTANNREEFDQRTKDVIAARAGYRCSFPACPRITIGPGVTSDQVASCGVAAHIFSASPNGPRGQGELTVERLSSASNGIWLCANHARDVDANGGRGYPASLLLSYKALREARANLEMSGIATPIGWIESIEISRCQLARPKPHALVQPAAKLNLAKITLLLGTNSSGKTAVCEWLAGAVDASALGRWCDDDLDYTVRLYSPDEHAVRIRTGNGTVTYELDGRPCVFNPLPIRVQWLSAPLGGEVRRDRSEIEFLAEYLHDTTEGIRRLIEYYRGHREERVSDRWVEDLWIEDQGKVMVRASWEKHNFSLAQLGSGGRGIVALTLAVLRASTSAWHVPTLLLVDNLFPSLNPKAAASALGLLGSAHRQFQPITSPENGPKIEWDGWAVKRLLPSEQGAELVEL
jgi:hypothetical protein